MKTVRVVVVDACAESRAAVRRALMGDSRLELVAEAGDAFAARQALRLALPDVVALGLSLPPVDGLTLLKNVMRVAPVPVVMLLRMLPGDAEATLAALELGAAGFFARPDGEGEAWETVKLRQRLLEAAGARLQHVQRRTVLPASYELSVSGPTAAATKFIAIGASAGVDGLSEVLRGLPAGAPGTVVAHPLPAMFTVPWAKRLDETSAMRVRVARDGDRIDDGCVLIAPGEAHFDVVRRGTQFYCRVQEGPLSFDRFFASMAPFEVRAAMLDGCGLDGVEGLKALRDAGRFTVVQAEQYAMYPEVGVQALKRGAVECTAALESIAGLLSGRTDAPAMRDRVDERDSRLQA